MQIALWKSLLRLAFSLLLGTAAVAVQVEAASDKGSEAESKDTPKPTATPNFKPESITSTGTVTVGGSPIEYQAVAGTFVVHPKGWDDAALTGDRQSKESEDSEESEQEPNEHKNPTAEASMFYVAYNFKQGWGRRRRDRSRSSTMVVPARRAYGCTWEHSAPGASSSPTTSTSPRLRSALSRTTTACSTRAIPCSSMHRARALVALPVRTRRSRFTAWTPTPTRLPSSSRLGSANMAGGTHRSTSSGRATARRDWPCSSTSFSPGATLVDFNGVIMLSQILNFHLNPDDPETNPGMDVPYELALPMFAATAWYHHKLPGPNSPAALEPFVKEVEEFATHDYARALAEGATLPKAERQAIAEKLHGYTGLPVSYILKANLRIDGGEFAEEPRGGYRHHHRPARHALLRSRPWTR